MNILTNKIPTSQNISMYKKQFLKKYNPYKSLEMALACGITASVQHNSLYRPGIRTEDKKALKCEWRTFLKSLIERYKTAQPASQYEKDIQRLKVRMNKDFSKYFRQEVHPKYKTDPGFRTRRKV